MRPGLSSDLLRMRRHCLECLSNFPIFPNLPGKFFPMCEMSSDQGFRISGSNVSRIFRNRTGPRSTLPSDVSRKYPSTREDCLVRNLNTNTSLRICREACEIFPQNDSRVARTVREWKNRQRLSTPMTTRRSHMRILVPVDGSDQSRHIIHYLGALQRLHEGDSPEIELVTSQRPV